jgi:hypothetical protein
MLSASLPGETEGVAATGTCVQELCDPETMKCVVLQEQNMYERLGGEEREWVELQAAKALEDKERGTIATSLPQLPVSGSDQSPSVTYLLVPPYREATPPTDQIDYPAT